MQVGRDWKGLPGENQCAIEHGVKQDHEYQFRVRAVNKIGTSDWSETQIERAEDRFS